jgi:hypothetical protein
MSMQSMALCTLVLAAFIAKVVADKAEETCSNNDFSEDSLPSSDRALIQIQRTYKVQEEKDTRTDQAVLPMSAVDEASEISAGIKSIAPLTLQGFDDVRQKCCTEEMAEFIRQLLLDKDLVVCAPGALYGLAKWYDCATEDDDSYDLESLESELFGQNSRAQNGDCPWVRPKDGDCPTRAKDCPTFPGVTNPPCSSTTMQPPTSSPTTTTVQPPTSSPTTTTVANIKCCAPEPTPSFLQQSQSAKSVAPAPPPFVSSSTVEEFDCTSPAPVQIYNKAGSDIDYHVADLDIETGEYTDRYTIPFKLLYPEEDLGPGGDPELNSVGVNPLDGRAYATVAIYDATAPTLNGGVSRSFYVVRFDKNKFEYLAKLPSPKKYGDNIGYNTATFSTAAAGRYYMVTKGKQQSLIVIDNLHKFTGYDKPQQVKPEQVYEDASDLPGKRIAGPNGKTEWIADMACTEADFDGKGESEYCFMLSKSDKWGGPPAEAFSRMYLLKMKPDKTGDEAARVWILKVVGNGIGKDMASKGWGAAWRFKGRVFFASNRGKGVYEVDQKSIDVSDGTYVKDMDVTLKYVGKSTATTRNDGLNCLDADSPWPDQGDCEEGEVQVDAVNGECPDNSVKRA